MDIDPATGAAKKGDDGEALVRTINKHSFECTYSRVLLPAAAASAAVTSEAAVSVAVAPVAAAPTADSPAAVAPAAEAPAEAAAAPAAAAPAAVAPPAAAGTSAFSIGPAGAKASATQPTRRFKRPSARKEAAGGAAVGAVGSGTSSAYTAASSLFGGAPAASPRSAAADADASAASASSATTVEPTAEELAVLEQGGGSEEGWFPCWVPATGMPHPALAEGGELRLRPSKWEVPGAAGGNADWTLDGPGHKWVKLSSDKLTACYNKSGTRDNMSNKNGMARSSTGFDSGVHRSEPTARAAYALFRLHRSACTLLLIWRVLCVCAAGGRLRFPTTVTAAPATPRLVW